MKLRVSIPHGEVDIFNKTPNQPLDLKSIKNTEIDARNATATIYGKELSDTVNNIVTGETPIVKNLSFDFLPGNQAVADIKAKKFINLNVKFKGELNANPINNMVRFTPSDINVNGIPVKRVLDFFGIKVGELVKIGKPSGSFFTSGDSIYFSPAKLVSAPVIDAHITKITTGSGTLSVYLGEDGIAPYQPKPVQGADNYLSIRTPNMNFSGFNLQNTDLTLVDGTPQDPFDIINDPSKKVITAGQVSIPDSFIDTALRQKAGGGSMKNMKFTMPNGQGKLNASMWGFLPISLNLDFSKSQDGELKVTPDKGRLLGFIPLPNSLLKKTLVSETEGTPEGNGVVVDLDKLADLKIAQLKEVRNENGKLVIVM